MKICFVHFSDLFYSSGSAVVYRRILAEISPEHEVVHVIGQHRSANAPAEIIAAYQRDLARVRPIFLPQGALLGMYNRLSGRTPFRQSEALPGLFFRAAFKKIFAKEKPDLIWWSTDYMRESLSSLWQARAILPQAARLHLSFMDPPEFWLGAGRHLQLYDRCQSLAQSFDCIGENFRGRLIAETGKPVFVINDYTRPGAVASAKSKSATSLLRATITGQIYGADDLQRFLRALGDAADQAELLWCGKPRNYAVLDSMQIPRNLRLELPGSLAREEIAGALCRCDFAYLSMPAHLPEFSRYSLPTKLVTYVEAGLPVAFHAPEDSEINRLNGSYGFGSNLSFVDEPVAALRRLALQPAPYREGLERLDRERFAKARVMANVRALLKGLDPVGRRDQPASSQVARPPDPTS